MDDLVALSILLNIIVIVFLLMSIFIGNSINLSRHPTILKLIISFSILSAFFECFWFVEKSAVFGQIVLYVTYWLDYIIILLFTFLLLRDIEILNGSKKRNIIFFLCYLPYSLLLLSNPFTHIFAYVTQNGEIILSKANMILSLYFLVAGVIVIIFSIRLILKNKNRNSKQFKNAHNVIQTIVIISLMFIAQVIIGTEYSTALLCIAFGISFIYIRKNEEAFSDAKASAAAIDAELLSAKSIQTSLVPTKFPAFPERKDFNIFAALYPSKEVGGDFYDFYMTDENHLVMIVGDVAGNGIPAALFMVFSKSIIKQNSFAYSSAAEILTHANNDICKDNKEHVFVTVWLAVLDLTTGIVDCANAGHEYPILRHNDGLYEVYRENEHGLVLGAVPGIEYKSYKLNLSPGDVIFMYTDGIPEACNCSGEYLGLDRMLEIMNKNRNLTDKEFTSEIFNSVNSFSENLPQTDDIAMLFFEYKGNIHDN